VRRLRCGAGFAMARPFPTAAALADGLVFPEVWSRSPTSRSVLIFNLGQMVQESNSAAGMATCPSA
jgi:hypothetical protein